MNARVTPPAKGEAEILKMPQPAQQQAAAPVAEAPRQPGPGPAPGPATNTAPPAAEAAPKRRRGGLRVILMAAVPLILIVGGGYFWLTGGRYEDTDNAYVTQPIVSLSADVSGKIVDVGVKENQTVKKGDELFKIDPSTYQIAVNQAEAALAAARQNVTQLRVALTTEQTKLASDQQALVIQQRSQTRNTDLANKGVATQATVDQGLLALQQAQAAVDQDQQAVQGALAALGGNANVATDDVPAVKQALAALALANQNLSKTSVVAPADGVISQVTILNVGQYVAAGTTVVSLVETGDTWIEANFKETQLDKIRQGLPAKVTVDAYPGVVFNGTVDSVSAATGAMFSLIPAQNATGNWVKVVQRVPVKISVPANPNAPLSSGMSSTVTVDTGKSTLDEMLGH